MKKLLFVALLGAFGTLYAAGLDTSAFAQGERNYFAIGMFLVFVLATLAITYFSSKKSQSAAGFYTALCVRQAFWALLGLSLQTALMG